MAEKNRKLRELATDDLQKQLNEAREELMNLRFQAATGELTDTSRLRLIRRQIARLLTILHERGQMSGTEGEA